jgi:hypothetical protein
MAMADKPPYRDTGDLFRVQHGSLQVPKWFSALHRDSDEPVPEQPKHKRHWFR